MRMVKEKFDPVQHDTETRPMAAFDGCTQMVEQRLNFAPVDVGAQRVGENGMKQVCVLMAHGSVP